MWLRELCRSDSLHGAVSELRSGSRHGDYVVGSRPETIGYANMVPMQPGTLQQHPLQHMVILERGTRALKDPPAMHDAGDAANDSDGRNHTINTTLNDSPLSYLLPPTSYARG